MPMRFLFAALALCLPLVLIGCGTGDPYTASTKTTTTVMGDSRQPPQERVGPRPEPDREVAAGAASPETALLRYAELSINWTAETLAARQRVLARISIDGARQLALLAAERISRDDTLRSSQVSNTGTVLSIAPATAGARGSWVVVTREKTVGRDAYRGLPATYHVTLAEVERTPSGWAVASWMPRS